MDQLVIEGLTKAYPDRRGQPVPVLENVTFSLCAGEVVSLMGESGSGKSTLARILIGLERPDAGRVVMDGSALTDLDAAGWRAYRRRIQAVFQDVSGTLNPMRSTRSNVESAMANLTDLDRRERRERTLRYMARVDLGPELLDRPVRRLSGGEQRRFAMLRAVLVEPRYLILDEITSGLDFLSCAAVLDTLGTYRQETGGGILLITHDMDTAKRISDRILLLRDGRIVREGRKIQTDNTERKK